MSSKPYHQGRLDVRDGDIVFIHKTNSLISKVISFFTRGIVTHCGIAFWATVDESNERRLMIVEAQRFARRRILNMSYYANGEITIVVGPHSWTEYSGVALTQLGTVKYSWFDVIYVGLREFLGKWVELPKLTFAGEICSEYVAKQLNREDTAISPQRLLDELIAEGNAIRVVISERSV